MDPYSFLNTAHTAYFAELYDQYLINPQEVEPSWRAFFQGFEFGIEESKKEKGKFYLMPENKKYKPIELKEENELIVWGIVEYVIKKV